MIYETIGMSEEFPEATLTTYVYDYKNDMKPGPRCGVIVCPGGGYSSLSEREADPIVTKFLAAGFNVFLLRYSVKENAKDYAPLKQAAHAIAYVRKNAEHYNIMPDHIFICGFSAGGHLAASSGILWNCPVLRKEFEGEPEGINRPDGMILSYPVITAGEFAHKNSIRYVSGNHDYGDSEIEEWSLDKHVDGTTPPAFIWHTFEDKTVPVQNSLMLANALTAAGVHFELHIYPVGVHGLSLATEEVANNRPEYVLPYVQGWIDRACEFIKKYPVWKN